MQEGCSLQIGDVRNPNQLPDLGNIQTCWLATCWMTLISRKFLPSLSLSVFRLWIDPSNDLIFCALAVATKSGLPWSPHDTQINAWKRSLCKSWKLWQKPKSGPAIVLVLECQMMSRITGCRDLTAKTLDFCMSYLPHVHLLAWQLGILNEQPQLSAGWFVFQSVSKANFSSLLSALWGSQLAGGKWSGGTSKVINFSSVFQKPVNTRHVINFWGVWPCQLEDTFFLDKLRHGKLKASPGSYPRGTGLSLRLHGFFFFKTVYVADGLRAWWPWSNMIQFGEAFIISFHIIPISAFWAPKKDLQLFLAPAMPLWPGRAIPFASVRDPSIPRSFGSLTPHSKKNE